MTADDIANGLALFVRQGWFHGEISRALVEALEEAEARTTYQVKFGDVDGPEGVPTPGWKPFAFDPVSGRVLWRKRA